jgi:hypothetical protein
MTAAEIIIEVFIMGPAFVRMTTLQPILDIRQFHQLEEFAITAQKKPGRRPGLGGDQAPVLAKSLVQSTI